MARPGAWEGPMRNFSTQNKPLAQQQGVAEKTLGEREDKPLPPPSLPAPELPRRHHTLISVLLGFIASLFWVGVGAAFLSGYLGPDRLLSLPLTQVAPIAAALILPPLLFFAIALLIARTLSLSDTAAHLLAASDRLL